ncbi:17.2 kDa protein 1 in recA 5'region [Paraglaciecola mesophila KMM 241]|uniref:17.2 kDa protein 1 in recA 5'region n=1 Tax=Paraglaciecola mesophila KMM 241 TaxID=1128912 RepID=K6Z7V6_9ALTE|nr:nicotinamide-nucleotide amidase [Paraglaciecola mesophila]GAC25073.1 17.2 kDa protein 1 in recA 5'region [Paraglaciecola mesophila KMM 241]|tara:strand:+ start:2134 stop:2646 length:513 start_codon:yes stop_codon:yes gene_type:complete
MTNYSIQLAQQLGEHLQQLGWSVTCAESCTGGGIGYAITSTSGSSSWFKSGYITYSNEAKQVMLGVSEQTLNEHGAVSQPVVEQMAMGATKAAGANVAVSVSGIAGPDGGSDEKPVGTVWFGFSVNGEITTSCQCFSGDRHQVRDQAIEYALNQLVTRCKTESLPSSGKL